MKKALFASLALIIVIIIAAFFGAKDNNSENSNPIQSLNKAFYTLQTSGPLPQNEEDVIALLEENGVVVSDDTQKEGLFVKIENGKIFLKAKTETSVARESISLGN